MKIRYIIVPKDKNAEKALDFDEATSDQLIEFKLLENDFTEIYRAGVFIKINEINNCNIDDYEDEMINDPNTILHTIEHLKNESELAKSHLKQYILNIISLFEKAINRNIGVYFYF